MISTEAFILEQGTADKSVPAELKREIFSFPNITDEEVLVEPIYGCWEANMTHAMKRQPVDICRLRRERKIVIGNAGVVRVLEIGKSVTTVKQGDVCIISPIGQLDAYGYMHKVFGFDQPNSVGVLAKKTKLHEKQLVLLPPNTKYPLQRWAAYSVRYLSAWDNWKVAHGCFRVQMPAEEFPTPFVWGWGGGVALAEITLAQIHGCRVAMISSDNVRLQLIEKLGITPIDRRQFGGLQYDDAQYQSDHKYRARYLQAERLFLDIVREHTGQSGVSIFIDNIGTPVSRATVKALARQGVLTTTGWDQGSKISFSRINECTNRHVHVHTHGGRYPESNRSVFFAEENGWLAPVDGHTYEWDSIPQLAQDYSSGKLSTYFPIFEVNPPKDQFVQAHSPPILQA